MRSMQIEELASAMGKARQLRDALPEELLVSPVVIDHQAALPALQEIPGMLAAAAGLIVEDDDRCSPLQLIASIGPERGPPGLALARIQLLNRGLIGVQHLAPLEQCAQTIHQGLQGQTPNWPTHWASVERAIGAPCRSLIFSMR